MGTVVSLSRYPVKSMRAEPLEAAPLHWPWLLGDRQYAFVKGSDTSDFPWLTARDVPSLVRFRARYNRSDDPVHSAVVVTDPDGAEFDLRDPALAARLADAARTQVRLLRLGRGCFDAMPVSILTTTSAAAVEAAHGSTVAIERFRANLVIQTEQPQATEGDWLGRSLAIGSEGTCLSVGGMIPRCAMVGIDAATGARDPSVVWTVVQRFANLWERTAPCSGPGRSGSATRSHLLRCVLRTAEGGAGRGRHPQDRAHGAMSPLANFLSFYGVLYAAFGVASPFFPGLLQHDGLGPAQVGVMLAAGTAVRLLAGLLGGRLADRTGWAPLVLAGYTAVAAAVALAYGWTRGPVAAGIRLPQDVGFRNQARRGSVERRE